MLQLPTHQGILLRGAALAAAAKVLSYRTRAEDTSDATIYTFAAQDIGTAAADRRVIVAVAGTQGTRTVSTVTVDGAGLTFVGRKQTGVTTVEIWIGLITSGATASIVVTWSGLQDRCGIGVWAATGLSSDTAVGTQTWEPTEGGGVDVTVTTVAGGFHVAVACSHSAGVPVSTWTTITERYDVALEGTQPYHSGADGASSGPSTTFNHHMVTVSNSNAAGFVAAF